MTDTETRGPQDGEAIKAARYARKLTLVQLSNLSNVSRTTLGYAELNKRGITLGLLEKVAAALEVPVTDLLREPYKSRVGALTGSNRSGAA